MVSPEELADDVVSGTRATYDELATGFLEWWDKPRPDLDADLARFAAEVQGRGPVIDAGCGLGRDCLALRRRGLPVMGIDLSLAMLLAGSVPGVVQADMRALPVRSRAVSGVWCQAALLHVPREDAPHVLGDFARVLRPGGFLHLVVSEGEGEGWESGHYGSDRARWFVHYTADGLQELLIQAGFAVVDVERRTFGRDWLRVQARLV